MTRCVHCGGPVGASRVTINGRTYCDNCAKSLGLYNQIFPFFDEITAPVLGLENLEFNTNFSSCPKCGRTRRELENGAPLGCVECYNTFEDYIESNLLRNQGTTEYCGRKPGEKIEISTSEMPKPEAKTEEAPAEEAPAEKKLSDMTVNELKEQMLKAVRAENYKLAAQIRDEIKSREEGN